MTTKMKVVFVIVSAVSALFTVLMSTPFAIDAGGNMLSAVADMLGLHEAPTLSALAVLVIPGLYLYLAFTQRRRS
ncbi:MAG: hypothetical protein A4E62_00672 [Syntrophorhabdus sp. PtaU1.Bin002]|nr:MAG: hypothetical protein A4E58_01239 [Syntrophorhabdus sp. PtaB.Bin006]OPY72964.1 MAG: hypothetical protein A4E62_00672 [Syntrophorhabdus sp. PtaU1.Bin002]